MPTRHLQMKESILNLFLFYVLKKQVETYSKSGNQNKENVSSIKMPLARFHMFYLIMPHAHLFLDRTVHYILVIVLSPQNQERRTIIVMDGLWDTPLLLRLEYG